MNTNQKTPQLRLFNTASRQLEVLTPIKPGHVTMYTCGPTVYNYAHIGNFRTYIFEDLLRRTIKFLGMTVTQVMNLTDVDDKTIKGAIAKGVSLKQYTQTYKDAFFSDLKLLNIEPAEKYPAATDYIGEMIKMIQVLLEKEIAYKGGDGSVYYSIQKFPKYGCLSHLNLEELKTGASERIVSDEYEKDHISDFVLWKAYDPSRDGNIYWESPFGKGRPGWHLECSAMAMNLLGNTLDIHVGAVDNMFPHHENEIAQSEACSEKPFAHIWLHSEHLIVDGRKMSKSLGNVYTLKDLLSMTFTPTQIRYMLLQTHFKTQLNFTFAGLEAVKETLNRLNNFTQKLLEIIQNNTSIESNSLTLHSILDKANEHFTNALADNLNISIALAALFELVREVNSLIDKNLLNKENAEQVIQLLKHFDSVLGIFTFENPSNSAPKELQEALEKRMEARRNKDWALADQLRDYILSKGYIIEDTPNGARLKKE